MTDVASTSESKHVPWNKGKIGGVNPRFAQSCVSSPFVQAEMGLTS